MRSSDIRPGGHVKSSKDQVESSEDLRHTGRFDSKFSHIFKSNTKFEFLYERRPKVNIHVKYSAK